MLTPFSFLLRRAQRISINFIIFSFIVISLLGVSASAQTAHAVGISNAGGGFNGAWGVAVDSSGNVYVADTWNNAVKQIPSGCADPSCVKTLGSGFSSPDGVAVDSAGNVFVADYGSNSVKEIVAAGGYQTVNTLASGFNMPWSVAVDSIGNVYVADTGNYVVKEIVAAGGYQTVKTLLSGLSLPVGVAVDGVGNVYVADWQTVKEFVAVGGYTTMNTLGSGFSYPAGVAVDGAGNVYVADDGNNAVKEIVAASGYATVTTLLHSSSMNPHAVAVDSGGNVYVADPWNSVVTEISTSGAVKAPTTAVGSTSSAVTIAFTFDTGGQIGAPVVLTRGAANLDFADAGTGTCTTNGTSQTYSAGDTCTVDVKFTPKYPGQRMGAVQLTTTSGTMIATSLIYGTGTGPQVVFSPGTQTTVGSGLHGPSGVAVDGNGNVYISDYYNSRVLKAPSSDLSCSTPGDCVAIQSPAFGYSAPVDVALDGAGNVYVVDNTKTTYEVPAGCSSASCVSTVLDMYFGTALTVDGSGNLYVTDWIENSVVKVPPGCASANCQISLGSGLNQPQGTAVDSVGNVFIADFGNNRIVEVPWTVSGYGQQITVATLTSPNHIAVDGVGNLYISEGMSTVVMLPWTGSGYGPQITVISGLNLPEALAVSGNGNVYISDYFNNRVLKLDVVDAPALTFASTAVGSTSNDSPQTVALANIGNAPLSFPVLSSGNNPTIGANFTLDSSGETACPLVTSSNSSAGTLAAGAICTLPISFVPEAAGSISTSLTLTDNNLNASPSTTQSILLSGTATQGTPVFSGLSSATITYGQGPTALTGTILAGTAAPTGDTVTVSVNGQNYTSSAITSSGSFSVSVPTATLSVSGSPYTVTYQFAGDGNFGSATDASTSLTVTKAASNATLQANSSDVLAKANVTLTAKVSSTTSGTPTGTVSFIDGTTSLGSATLDNTGTATLTINTLTAGAHSLTATYGGDTNFTGTTSAALTETVQDFQFVINGGSTSSISETVKAGGTATYQFQVSPTGGTTFPSAVTMTLTGLPAGATYTITPSSIASGNAAQTITVQVQTSSHTAALRQTYPGAPLFAFGMLLPLFGMVRLRRAVQNPNTRAALLLLSIVILVILGMSACGGGSRQPQTYTMQLTASSGALQHTATLDLTVQ
jgi:DNA-binding beta-propeller fold protein YncE